MSDIEFTWQGGSAASLPGEIAGMQKIDRELRVFEGSLHQQGSAFAGYLHALMTAAGPESAEKAAGIEASAYKAASNAAAAVASARAAMRVLRSAAQAVHAATEEHNARMAELARKAGV